MNTLGLRLGIDLARFWPRGQARDAISAAIFMAAGCIDAPDEIPAGSHRSFDYSDLGDECYGIDQTTVPREPHDQRDSEER